MRATLLSLLAVLASVGRACAELEAWTALGEAALHSHTVEYFDVDPVALFAPCDAKGNLSLPKKYEVDYEVKASERQKAEKPLKTIQRFSNIQTAIAEGYLPQARKFIPGMGLSMVNPDLINDGKYLPEKPDMLLYVRRRGKPLYRLVGFGFAAGAGKPPPYARAKRTEKAAKQSPSTDDGWDYEKDLCFIVKPGHSATFYPFAEAPSKCKEGKRMPKFYRLIHWGLVYNPNGIFIDANPTVDYIDRTEKFGAICPTKPKEQ